mmetsp:Transcript_60840/g.156822  ORF Transcript_60840/g.156822 Transcript_60840/m.156822 type:complete len:111 (+) Transcript_60840:89-421(+)
MNASLRVLVLALLAFGADAAVLRRARAEPAPAPVLAPSSAPPAIKFEHEGFKKDWGEEWRAGDFPSYKETHSKTWRHDDVASMEDSQSDGKPSPGLTGDKVGAYLPMSEK